MRIDEILKKGKQLLSDCGIKEAELDAFYLLEYCYCVNRMEYLLHRDRESTAEEEKKYFSLIKKRAEHIPLQQLTGEQDFMGHRFLVNEHVLIPRQDTETLVEELLPLVKGKRVLDLCTGSGCILISLALGAGLEYGLGSDISEEALKVARENAKRLQADTFAKEGLSFVEANLFEGIEGHYDVIVSNPPYIETKELENLMPEVRFHEPLLALDGKEDGLYYYRRIIAGAAEYFDKEGILAFEIGYNQGEAVARMLREAGYCEVRVKKDLAGHDRIVLGFLKT